MVSSKKTKTIKFRLFDNSEIEIEVPHVEFARPKLKLDYSEISLQISQLVQDIRCDMARTAESVQGLSQKIQRDSEIATAAMNCGWIPFDGLPGDQIEPDGCSKKLDAFLASYTANNWDELRDTMKSKVAASGVDGEAIKTFDEALIAYDNGLYRCVVRTLFPEIERVARETLQGEQSNFERPKTDASLCKVQDEILAAPLLVLADSQHAFTVIDKLREHPYARVERDRDSTERFKFDAVPNRHASVHGFVNYSSPKNAFNMLVLAEFLFTLIMRIRDVDDRAGD